MQQLYTMRKEEKKMREKKKEKEEKTALNTVANGNTNLCHRVFLFEIIKWWRSRMIHFFFFVKRF